MYQEKFVQAHEYYRQYNEVVDPHEIMVRLEVGGGSIKQGYKSI